MALNDFSEKEKALRWRRTREFLRSKQLEALLIIGARAAAPVDRYLSNWIAGCTVIFPLDGEPTLLVPMIPAMLALRPETPKEERPWIDDIRAGARGSIIAATLQEKGLDRSRIGVVGLGPLETAWEGWIPFKTWDRVVNKLPRCSFEDVTSSYGKWTLVKSDEELAHVRRAAQVLEQAGAEMLKTVRPGASELEIYAAVRNVLHSNGVYVPQVILCSGPDNVSWGEPVWIHGVGAPRVLAPGDIVLAEIFAASGRLDAQVQMAVAVPPVSSLNAECARLAREAYEVGLRNLRPGKTFAEVVAAMENVLDRPGVWHLTPLIHSMNPHLCIGPTGVRIERLPGVAAYRQVAAGRIRGGDVTLAPGMVFELEPNACIERHRVNIGGTVIVGADGPEPLNEIPAQMRYSGMQEGQSEA